MTKKENQEYARDKMKEYVTLASHDPEVAHELADKLMQRILRREGYVCAANIFEAMPKWYA